MSECLICRIEHPVNTGLFCNMCTAKWCIDCDEGMKASGRTLKCPQCRAQNSSVRIGVPLTPRMSIIPAYSNEARDIVSIPIIACSGKYAGGTKPCTYDTGFTYRGKAYCPRCVRIATGTRDRNVDPLTIHGVNRIHPELDFTPAAAARIREQLAADVVSEHEDEFIEDDEDHEIIDTDDELVL